MSPSKTETVNCKRVLTDRKLVPDDQIKLFCNILRFKGELGEGCHNDSARQCYTNRIRPLISKLNFPLSKPNRFTKMLLPQQTEYTYLCDMHVGLNADFIHQWFKLLSLEVGARLEVLRSSTREHVGAYAWDNVVKPLTRLHKMWLEPDDLERAFGGFVHYGFGNTIIMIDAVHQKDGCEACILARIGSHINTLWALRCLVKSRMSLESQAKHRNRLRLLRLTRPWIELWQNEYGADEEPTNKLIQKKWNTGLAEELYEKRQEMELDQYRRRRAQRHFLELHHSNSKKYKEYVKALEEGAAENNMYDAENDIIDTYAALRATQRISVLLSADITVGKVSEHPAYRCASNIPRIREESPSVISQSENSPYIAQTDPAYLESRYSIDTFRNNERVIKARSAALARLQGVGEWEQPRVSMLENMAAMPGMRCTQATVWPVQTDGFQANLTVPGKFTTARG